jgi:hypothetical protein
MKNLKVRKADDSHSEFAYLAREAAFRQFVEQVRGWYSTASLKAILIF